jgi:hypothetical protein
MTVAEKYIDPMVLDKLAINNSTRVIVMLDDNDGLIKEEMSANDRKEFYRKSEESVLNTLSKDDFVLEYKFNIINAFGGYISRSGLEKISMNDKVIRVESEKMLHPAIKESVPLINATEVWDGTIITPEPNCGYNLNAEPGWYRISIWKFTLSPHDAGIEFYYSRPFEIT